MKYKVTPDKPLFKEFLPLIERQEKGKAELVQYMNEIGSTAFATGHDNALSGFKFEEPPKNWKRVGNKYQNLFFPYARNKKELERITQIERVRSSEIKEVLSYPTGAFMRDGRMIFVSAPGYVLSHSVVLLETANEISYKPHEDMEEILESEFEGHIKTLNEEKRRGLRDENS